MNMYRLLTAGLEYLFADMVLFVADVKQIAYLNTQ